MNILMLTYEIWGRGGNVIRCHSLAKNLASFGHDVTLIAAATKSRLIPKINVEENVRVVEMPDIMLVQIRHSGLSPIETIVRQIYLQNRKFDIIHSFGHRPTVSRSARRLRRRAGIPHVADWADLWGYEGIGSLRGALSRATLARVDEYWENSLYADVDCLTAISKSLAERAAKLGLSADRI